MKYYLAVIEMAEWSSSHRLFSTREKAKDFLYAEIGAYIAECIKQGDKEEAISFVEKLKFDGAEDTIDYFCVKQKDSYDEYYIEEIELDE